MPVKRDGNLFGLMLYITGLLVLSTLLAASLSKTEIPTWMVVALSTGLALLGLLMIVRRLEQIGTALETFRRGERTDLIKRLRFDPLAGIVENVNALLEPAGGKDVRHDLLEQVEHSAAQQERNRLARELHDSIKQQLFSIQMSAATAQVRQRDDAVASQDALEDVRKSTQEAMVEMNALLQQLSPQPLERVGLAQALRELCEALGYRSGAGVTCEISELPPNAAFPPGAQEGLFRIAQEALSNVARHARAAQVTLRLSWNFDSEQVELELHDDGQGFNAEGVESGRGLANIRERVEQLGGWMKLRSTIKQGTELKVGIPLRQVEARPLDEALSVGPAFNRVVFAGFGFGVLATAAFSLAWYFNAPLQYAAGWVGVNGLAAVAGYLLAGMVLLLAGWLVGRQAKVNPVLEGAAGGLVAALTGFGLMGAAWAALSGSNALMLNGLEFVPDEGEAIRLLVSATAGIFNAVHALFWGMVFGGAGLGALGGLIAGRGKELKLPEDWNTGLRSLLPPVLVSSAMACLLGAFLLPVVESSGVDQLRRFGFDTPSGNAFPLHAAVLICLATTAMFYLGVLGGQLRFLSQAIPLASPKRLINLHWDAFYLVVVAGVVGLAELYLAFRYWNDIQMSSPAALTGQVFSVYLIVGLGLASLGSAFLFAGQLDRLRLKLAETLQPAPTFVEYAGLIGVPAAMILAFLVIIMDGQGFLALGILLAEAVLLGFGLYLRRKRKQSRTGSTRLPREQAAWLSGNWAAYAFSFLAPVLAMMGSGLGILLLPVEMVQYLDVGRLPDLALPPLSVEELIQQLFYYSAAAFIGLLIVVMVQTGLTLLALSFSAMRARKGL